MNERRKRFCEHYAACGNAAQAAREAGYSGKTARQQGERLLTNADIAAYIRQLQDQATDGRIATIQEIKRFWSATMDDPAEKTVDRLRASELLAKSAGAFLHLRPGSDDYTLATGEVDGGDVIIYMPQMLDEKSCEWKEDDGDDAAK